MTTTKRELRPVLSNEFKIRLSNLYSTLRGHEGGCSRCTEYLTTGDGDLCESAKRMIFNQLYPESVEWKQ